MRSERKKYFDTCMDRSISGEWLVGMALCQQRPNYLSPTDIATALLAARKKGAFPKKVERNYVQQHLERVRAKAAQ